VGDDDDAAAKVLDGLGERAWCYWKGWGEGNGVFGEKKIFIFFSTSKKKKTSKKEKEKKKKRLTQRLAVEVVGRLVEDQHVRGLPHRRGDDALDFLAPGEAADVRVRAELGVDA